MPDATLTYVYPAWGLVPTKEQTHKSRCVHAVVVFTDDSPGPVDIVHNLQLPYGPPLQPPEWVPPFVLVNPMSGGPAAPQYVLNVKDGNTITINRTAIGPGTALTLSVWIIGPKADSIFGWLG